MLSINFFDLFVIIMSGFLGAIGMYVYIESTKETKTILPDTISKPVPKIDMGIDEPSIDLEEDNLDLIMENVTQTILNANKPTEEKVQITDDINNIDEIANTPLIESEFDEIVTQLINEVNDTSTLNVLTI